MATSEFEYECLTSPYNLYGHTLAHEPLPDLQHK